MALTSELDSLAQHALIKKVRDIVDLRRPWLAEFKKKLTQAEDGQEPDYPVRYQRPNVENYTEYGSVDVGHKIQHTRARLDHYGYYHTPIVVSRQEQQKITGGKWSVAKMAKLKFDGAREAMDNDIAADLYIGDTPTTDARQLIGLDYAIGQTTTYEYGGITTATTAWLPTVDSSTVLADNLVDAINNECITVRDYMSNLNLGLTTGAIWKKLWNELEGKHQWVVSGKGPGTFSVGANALLVNDIPIFHDPHATASHLYLLDTSTWEATYCADGNFKYIEFATAVNAPQVLVAHLLFDGALMCTDRRKNVCFTALA
jgi:hypothetical protein